MYLMHAFMYFQVGAFSVLKELVVVLPDCLADHIGSLIPGIEKALSVSTLFFSLRLKFFLDVLFSFRVYMFSIFSFCCLQEKSSTSNLKIEALIFTRLVLASHSPSVFHPYIKVSSHLFIS